jgi:hypothetical protein
MKTAKTNSTRDFYVSICPETKRMFICQSGRDGNIAEGFGGKRFAYAFAGAPALMEAAQAVIDNWSGGDLAGAVWALDALENARPIPPPETIREPWWAMTCPRCGDDSGTEIAITVWGLLTPDGTDIEAATIGDHKWTPGSPAHCAAWRLQGNGQILSNHKGRAVIAFARV